MRSVAVFALRRPGCALLAVLLAASTAAALAQVSLPPRTDRSVHDLAGVISQEHAALMERLHRALFQKTGVAIVVVTVPRLDGEPIEDFAVRLGKHWGVGRKGEDRGVVVALAIQERRVFIATGYGVEGFLPDGKVGGILDSEVLPSLRRDAWSEGMVRASAALTREAAAEYGVVIDDLAQAPAPRRATRGRGGISRIVPFLILAAIVFLVIREPWLLLMLMGSGGRRGRGGFRTGGFGGGGFGGGTGFGGFGGGGFGGGGAGRGF